MLNFKIKLNKTLDNSSAIFIHFSFTECKVLEDAARYILDKNNNILKDMN